MRQTHNKKQSKEDLQEDDTKYTDIRSGKMGHKHKEHS